MFRYRYPSLIFISHYWYYILIIFTPVSYTHLDVYKRQVATYLSVYNKQTADVVSDIDSIIQSYLKNENIFETQKDTINRLREQIVTQTETLLKDNEQYSRLSYFLKDTYRYKDELLLYMGANVPKSYLVILQNSSERRPNG